METPVADIASLLLNSHCVLKKGNIRSLRYLGNLKTEFGAIGPLFPSAHEGEKKFRVSEMAPVLIANPEVEDNGLLQAIEKLMAKDERGEVSYNVTILDCGAEYLIKDGNKRTIAFFENKRAAGIDNILYPVFVVSVMAIANGLSTAYSGPS